MHRRRAGASSRSTSRPSSSSRVPCAKCASTSRGCTAPRSRTNSSTACAALPLRRRPAGDAARGCISACTRARHEAVVDEDVLLDAERGVAPLEIAGAVAVDAMAQRQVLRARRRADRVGLHEAERVDRALAAWSAGRGCGRRRSGAGRRALAAWPFTIPQPYKKSGRSFLRPLQPCESRYWRLPVVFAIQAPPGRDRIVGCPA